MSQALKRALSKHHAAWTQRKKDPRKLRLVHSSDEVPALRTSPLKGDEPHPASQDPASPPPASEADASPAPERESVGKSVLGILQQLREQRVRFEQLVGGARYREIEQLVQTAGAKTQGAILDTHAG